METGPFKRSPSSDYFLVPSWTNDYDSSAVIIVFSHPNIILVACVYSIILILIHSHYTSTLEYIHEAELRCNFTPTTPSITPDGHNKASHNYSSSLSTPVCPYPRTRQKPLLSRLVFVHARGQNVCKTNPKENHVQNTSMDTAAYCFQGSSCCSCPIPVLCSGCATRKQIVRVSLFSIPQQVSTNLLISSSDSIATVAYSLLIDTSHHESCTATPFH